MEPYISIKEQVLFNSFISVLKQYDKYILKDKDFIGIIEYILQEADEKNINFYEKEWKNFINSIKNKLSKYKVNIRDVSIFFILEDFLYDISNYPYKYDNCRIYPNKGTMGWILNLKNGEIELFEGSDEPTKEDIIFLNKFTIGKWIKLYSTQDYEFVQSWKLKGIPANIFFASSKQIALHYWHTTGNDILVSIELWNKDLQPVEENIYKTEKIIKNFKNLKIIG